MTTTQYQEARRTLLDDIQLAREACNSNRVLDMLYELDRLDAQNNRNLVVDGSLPELAL